MQVNLSAYRLAGAQFAAVIPAAVSVIHALAGRVSHPWLPHDVELDSVEQRVVLDGAGVRGPTTQRLEISFA